MSLPEAEMIEPLRRSLLLKIPLPLSWELIDVDLMASFVIKIRKHGRLWESRGKAHNPDPVATWGGEHRDREIL